MKTGINGEEYMVVDRITMNNLEKEKKRTK